MKKLGGFLLCLVAACAASSASAQQQPSVPAPQGLEGKPIDEIEFAGVNLDAAIQILEEKCPDFQAVIVADPRNSGYIPMVPNMRLRDIPAKQVIDVLESALPEVKITSVKGEKHTVYVLRLHRNDGPPTPTAKQQEVAVFPVAGLIPPDSKDHAKDLNKVVSLLESAIEGFSPSEGAKLNVHAETGTIIARGTPEQIGLIRSAIEAMQSNLHGQLGIELARKRDAEAAAISSRDMEMAMRAKEQAVEAERRAMVEDERQRFQQADRSQIAIEAEHKRAVADMERDRAVVELRQQRAAEQVAADMQKKLEAEMGLSRKNIDVLEDQLAKRNAELQANKKEINDLKEAMQAMQAQQQKMLEDIKSRGSQTPAPPAR